MIYSFSSSSSGVSHMGVTTANLANHGPHLFTYLFGTFYAGHPSLCNPGQKTVPCGCSVFCPDTESQYAKTLKYTDMCHRCMCVFEIPHRGSHMEKLAAPKLKALPPKR